MCVSFSLSPTPQPEQYKAEMAEMKRKERKETKEVCAVVLDELPSRTPLNQVLHPS